MEDLIINGKSNKGPTFLFSHGAGAPMDNDFMNFFAEKLSLKGFKVVRFEFEYMKQRRDTGSKRPPDRMPKLIERYTSVFNLFKDTPLFIGGKSMGGRVASIITSQNPEPFLGCICLGYPFHPQKKPENLRVDHLMGIDSKILICQGERDSLGNLEEVKSYNLPSNIEAFWLKDGDHSFKPRKLSGTTEQENCLKAVNKIDDWAKNIIKF